MSINYVLHIRLLHFKGICLFTVAGVFSSNDLNNMIEESQKMSKFNNSHVMKLVGVCIDKGESPLIVMPFMIYGSLLSYLRKHRAELTIASDDIIELVTTNMRVCVCVLCVCVCVCVCACASVCVW